MDLAGRIRKARNARKMSQAALAEAMDVSPGTVAGWELGTHAVRSTRMRELAGVLGLKVAELIP